jgi:diguanylate cyclase
MTDKKPFEIAREALKQLTARKLAPTPVNYQALYFEIAGLPNVPSFPEDPLRQIAQALPARNPGQQKQKSLLEYAIGQRNWQGVQSALVAYAGFGTSGAAPSDTAPAPLPAAAPNIAALTSEFMEQIARMIEYTLPALGTDDARFQEQVKKLLQAMRDPAAEVTKIKTLLADFSHRLSYAAEDQAEIKATLLKLLHLIIQNIGDLSIDDSWLKGQTDALMAVATPPLTLRRLDDVERRLKDVIFKQTEAKGRALEAQEELRKMLATFIERLSQVTVSSSTYHSKMEESVRQIEQAKKIEEIAPVLKDVINATRVMASETLHVRDELRTMREKTQATEAELIKLHKELDRVSTQARHDTLTGALNRQGLDEALNREISGVRRKETPLCVGLLDIDNFKQLNDAKGHDTGDAALAHLAAVARESMRPQDTLARYGGEEFVLLLPDTPLDKGIEAMTRLQRELTKRFFLAGNEKILITFSAGVAQLGPDESGADAIKRADQAMYLAKRAGKNRVLGA